MEKRIKKAKQKKEFKKPFIYWDEPPKLKPVIKKYNYIPDFFNKIGIRIYTSHLKLSRFQRTIISPVPTKECPLRIKQEPEKMIILVDFSNGRTKLLSKKSKQGWIYNQKIPLYIPKYDHFLFGK